MPLVLGFIKKPTTPASVATENRPANATLGEQCNVADSGDAIKPSIRVVARKDKMFFIENLFNVKCN
jgi:hypothetical protein